MPIMRNLRKLYEQMNEENNVQIFNFDSGIISFNVCFSICENPYVLAITSRTDAPQFFRFEVNPIDFSISDKMNEKDYYRLVKLLNHNKNSGKFKPADFLNNLDGQAPKTLADRPSTAEILAIRHDITEDRDRTVFNCWRPHQSKHVTQKNLAKTLALIGRTAYEYSKANNVSSVWIEEKKEN